MSKLFKLNDENTLEFTEHALGIGPFYDLWHRDLTVKKERAMKELTFVYCIVSMNPDNSYREFPSKQRVSLASQTIFGKEVNYMTDKTMTKAIDAMLEVDKSFAKEFLRSIINNIGKLKNFLSAVDLDEKDINGKPIYNMKQYSDTLSKQADLLKSMQEAIKLVDEEKADKDARIRGDARRETDI
jgi:hypothetical protein